ncbi:5122_t:CDS:2, partial [Rhizophagus irregularis]
SIQRGLQSYHVAIKSLLYNNNECMNEIVREIQLYHQLNYCSISKIYGVTRKVLEFADNGEMIDYFRNRCQTIYMDDFINIIVQIARLLLILHEDDIFGINII